MKFRVACLLILSLSALTGCETLKSFGDSSSSDEDYTGWSAEKFRTNAKEAIEGSNYCFKCFKNYFFINYSGFSDNVLRIPEMLLPPDCNADITF